MMIDRLHALSGLCSSEGASFPTTARDVTFDDLLDIYCSTNGGTALHAAVREVLLRILESSILRDPVISTLLERWDALFVDAERILRERIHVLTRVNPPDELVAHLRKVLGGSAAQRGRREANYERYIPDLFQRVALSHPRRELRCKVCGYHFIKENLGEKRRNNAIAEGLVLASTVRPEREGNSDYWKPVRQETSPNRFATYTQLTIDHSMPEEALGWSDVDNLEILCQYCNGGKLAYRWALEAISFFGAGGLADYPNDRPHSRLRQAIVVSAYRFHRSVCTACAQTASDVELTVRRAEPASAQATRSLAPWSLTVLCYDCVRTL